MKIALVPGHNSRKPGYDAVGDKIPSEFPYAVEVAEKMVELAPSLVPGCEIKIFKREYTGNYHTEIKRVYALVDDWGAALSQEIHYNAFNSKSTGTETLSSGSTKSLALATVHQQVQVNRIGLADRGVKIRKESDRGGWSLAAGRAPAIITEHFFGSNPRDVEVVAKIGITGIAKIFLEGHRIYGLQNGLLSQTVPGVAHPVPTVPTPVPAETQLNFHRTFTKEQFLVNNQKVLTAIAADVNASIERKARGSSYNPLTLEDLAVIFYLEAGVGPGGVINTHFVHSEGEKGLLPLPSNLKNWIALEWDVSTPQGNFMAFAHYLGVLKNSDVGRKAPGGITMYKGLFNTDQSEIEQARILAGAIHGYFYPPNFKLTLPIKSIADACAAGDPSVILKGLSYKNAGSVVANRMKNLRVAEALFESN